MRRDDDLLKPTKNHKIDDAGQNVGDNQISAEGARALAANITLTTLDLDSMPQMTASLTEATKTKEDSNVVEKSTDKKSSFQFFTPPKPPLQSIENQSTKEESMERKPM
jgi:hypothetical protein